MLTAAAVPAAPAASPSWKSHWDPPTSWGCWPRRRTGYSPASRERWVARRRPRGSGPASDRAHERGGGTQIDEAGAGVGQRTGVI